MIKKILKIVVILVVSALIVIQFFRIDKTVPAIVEAETLDAAVTVPDNVREIIGRSCTDCHTYKTVYPWYSNIQPFAWFLKNHIDDGHRKLNFSVFNTYTLERKSKKLDAICENVESKEMPLPSYLWIHRNSVLSETDVKTLCDWANAEKAKIAG